MNAEIKYLDPEKIAVTFPYEASIVNQIKSLNNRKWNAKKQHWEIHLAHLAQVMRILTLHPNQVPKDILENYQENWLNQKIKIRLTHHHFYLSGANIPVEKIDQVTSFFLPGHNFSRKFIEKKWDGKKHLYQRSNHSIPTGLFPKVIKILKKEKLAHELIDERNWAKKKNKIALKEELKLRPYQKQALKAAIENKRGVIQIATGGGKTILALSIIAKLKIPAMFFVHTRDLLYQAKSVFEKFLDLPIGQLGDGVIDIQPITVAMIQTTTRAIQTARHLKSIDKDDNGDDDNTDITSNAEQIAEALENIPLVIFDECHHLPANSFYHVAMLSNSAGYRFGLSATPFRDDEQDLLTEAAIGPKIAEVSASELIKKKFLIPPRIVMLSVDKLKTQKRYRTYQDIYKNYIVENKDRNQNIAEVTEKLHDSGHSVLILVTQINHGNNIKKLIPQAEFIQGADDTELRNEMIESLRNKELKILIATTLADEGLDIPSLDAIILAGAGKSATRAFQRIGRALRPSEGKERAIVVDFFDQAPYLQEQSIRRLTLYKTEPEFQIETRGFSLS